MLTASDFLLANFYPSGPYMLHLLPGISSLLICTFLPIQPQFFQNLFLFFSVLVVANTGSCVGPQNEVYNIN